MKARFHRGSRAGMTLFEVILALALFVTAAVALVTAMNSIGLAVVESRTMRTVQQGLESIMDEYSKQPQIAELDKELKPGADGISYRIKISPVDKLRNQAGNTLSGLFQIRVVAKWVENNQKMEMEAETLRYAGMFIPNP